MLTVVRQANLLKDMMDCGLDEIRQAVTVCSCILFTAAFSKCFGDGFSGFRDSSLLFNYIAGAGHITKMSKKISFICILLISKIYIITLTV